MEKTILNLFGFNLESLPDSSFNESGIKANSQGDLFKDHSAGFKDKTFAIFDKIDVRDVRGGKNILFICSNFTKMNLWGFRKLINSLNALLGPDHLKRRRYCIRDFRILRNKKLELYSLRNWSNLKSLVLDVDVILDRKNNALLLIILGVGKYTKSSSV